MEEFYNNNIKPLNDALGVMLGIIPVTYKGGEYEPQVTVIQDDMVIHCNHVNSEIEEVSLERWDLDSHRWVADEGTLRPVCQVCGAQQIGGKWYESN